jgi:hypothetical protein
MPNGNLVAANVLLDLTIFLGKVDKGVEVTPKDRDNAERAYRLGEGSLGGRFGAAVDRARSDAGLDG